ncbi:MAG: cytochrome c [Betaproteobacteria bacterium]|nr:cytochrome c [Betaproteobacteria bacterium]MBI2960768.1 cytochrome c [Betaproteobacteria bacterium]
MTGAAAALCVPLAFMPAALLCGEGVESPSTAPPLAQISPRAQLPRAGRAFGARSHGIAERGREHYATYCTPCHGTRGEGDGPLADVLVPRPARHSDAAFMNSLSDEHLFRLLKDGGPALGKSPLMGVWSRILSDEQIWDLIAFIRSLARQSD